MFLRQNSTASHRPHRAKSTSSIKYRAAISSEDSSAAAQELHQDALTAANLAYERANQSKVARFGATAGRGEQHLQRQSGNGPELGRRQSVRFAGPNAVPTKAGSITRREVPGYRRSLESDRDSLSARFGGRSMNVHDVGGTALPGEYSEDYVASEPSSYRKLRKARSLFIPSKAPSAIFAQGAAELREPSLVQDPRLRRSFSFLRGVTDRISTGNRQYTTHDAAIQMARDTYLRQLEQQRLKEQPSIFGLRKRQKPQKAFRRTVRTSSTNSYGAAISSPLSSVEPQNQNGAGPKVRTISQAWKEKLKRLFKRSSDGKGVIPVQHLDASHPHYGGHVISPPDSVPYLPSTPEPNAELLHRVSSLGSSLHSEAGFGFIHPRTTSLRSADGEDNETNDKSRVTSWTDSTATNTLNMPHTMERKRLSIIKEDGGPHQSSLANRTSGDPSNGYANFRHPIDPYRANRPETKRVFSALQKQIDKNSRKDAYYESDSGTDNDFDQQIHRQTISNSMRASQAVDDTFDIDRQRCGMDSSASTIVCAQGNTLVNESCQQNTPKDHTDDDRKNLAPQQIAAINEPNGAMSKRPLHEIKSAFFPPSTRLERSNMSPFRRLMYVDSEDEDTKIRSDVSDKQPAISAWPGAGSVTGSGSVYSRSSGGRSQKPTISHVSLSQSDSSGETGTAIIIATNSPEHEWSAKPFFPQRYSSAKSSADWKNFMASQVASLESVGGQRDRFVDGYPVKERSHRREGAQLDEDDVVIGVAQAPSNVPKQPLGIIQGNAIRRARSMASNLPPTDELSPSRFLADQKMENAPITPSSMSSRGYSGTDSSLSPIKATSSNVPQKIPHASLLSKKASREISATTSPRHSSERTQRLRRLKSSSIMGLRGALTPNENHARPNLSTKPGHRIDDRNNLNAGRELMLTEAGMNTKFVNGFLKDRQQHTPTSEERGSHPAFL